MKKLEEEIKLNRARCYNYQFIWSLLLSKQPLDEEYSHNFIYNNQNSATNPRFSRPTGLATGQ